MANTKHQVALKVSGSVSRERLEGGGNPLGGQGVEVQT